MTTKTIKQTKKTMLFFFFFFNSMHSSAFLFLMVPKSDFKPSNSALRYSISLSLSCNFLSSTSTSSSSQRKNPQSLAFCQCVHRQKSLSGFLAVCYVRCTSFSPHKQRPPALKRARRTSMVLLAEPRDTEEASDIAQPDGEHKEEEERYEEEEEKKNVMKMKKRRKTRRRMKKSEENEFGDKYNPN